MAQHIGCYLEDERGKITKESGLNFADLNRIIWQVDRNKEKYKWLHTIDEYGTTAFNHLQIPFVISELKQLKTEISQNLKNLITQFIEFISQIDIQEFIKFYGD